MSYTANSVNQYTNRTVPDEFPVLGSVATTSQTVLVNGSTASRHDRYYSAVVAVTNTSTAVYKRVVVDTASQSSTGRVFVAKTPEEFAYDDDGNLTSDGRFGYTWNAENRLVMATTPGNLPSLVPRVKVRMAYDHQGRRILQVIQDRDGTNWVTRETRRFIYDGWNLVGELREPPSGTVTTNWYVWGLDLSQSLQGAGGVGGLLFTRLNGNSNNYYAFDGNGNVSEVVGANGAIRAHYEYDPYGNTIYVSGNLAESNPFRFSTKYGDSDLGLYYYGYRYYSPGIGRWMSRDPIGERGGRNLYAYVRNKPSVSYDFLGLTECSPPVSLVDKVAAFYYPELSGDFGGSAPVGPGDVIKDFLELSEEVKKPRYITSEEYRRPLSEHLVSRMNTSISWKCKDTTSQSGIVTCSGECWTTRVERRKRERWGKWVVDYNHEGPGLQSYHFETWHENDALVSYECQGANVYGITYDQTSASCPCEDDPCPMAKCATQLKKMCENDVNNIKRPISVPLSPNPFDPNYPVIPPSVPILP